MSVYIPSETIDKWNNTPQVELEWFGLPWMPACPLDGQDQPIPNDEYLDWLEQTVVEEIERGQAIYDWPTYPVGRTH